jgi:hypothetical protein
LNKIIRIILLIIIFIGFLSNSETIAQSKDSTLLPKPRRNMYERDSLFVHDSIEYFKAHPVSIMDTTKPKEFKMTKSTTAAVLWSFAFPGLGQVYNEAYWKAPIFAGAAGTLVYFIIFNQNNFIKYSDEASGYDSKINDLTNQLKIAKTEQDSLSITRLIYSTKDTLNLSKLKREFYRDNRDISGLYLLGVYLLAAVDAYTGAHLFDFSVSDDLSFRFQPTIRGGISASMRLRW